MEAAGKKMDADTMRDLGKRYRSLSADEKSYYNTIGQAATSCHREGRGAFAALSSRAKRNQLGHATEHQTPTLQAAELVVPYLRAKPSLHGLPADAWRSLPRALVKKPSKAYSDIIRKLASSLRLLRREKKANRQVRAASRGCLAWTQCAESPSSWNLGGLSGRVPVGELHLRA